MLLLCRVLSLLLHCVLCFPLRSSELHFAELCFNVFCRVVVFVALRFVGFFFSHVLFGFVKCCALCFCCCCCVALFRLMA